LTTNQIQNLRVLAAAVESDWIDIAEKTGKDWSEESDKLIEMPSSRRLERYLLDLDRPALEELIAVYLYFTGVKATFEECRKKASHESIEFFLWEPCGEMFNILSNLL